MPVGPHHSAASSVSVRTTLSDVSSCSVSTEQRETEVRRRREEDNRGGGAEEDGNNV